MMRRQNKGILTGSMLVGLTCLIVGSIHGGEDGPSVFQVDSGGAVRVKDSQLVFTVMQFDNTWKPMQSFVYDPSTREAALTARGGERMYAQYSYAQPSPRELSLRIAFSADTPVPTKRLILASAIKLREGETPKILFNGEAVAFPEVPDKNNYALERKQPEGKPSVAEVELAGGKFVVTGEFDLMLQDMRQWTPGQWSLRLFFKPGSGEIIQSALKCDMRFEPSAE